MPAIPPFAAHGVPSNHGATGFKKSHFEPSMKANCCLPCLDMDAPHNQTLPSMIQSAPALRGQDDLAISQWTRKAVLILNATVVLFFSGFLTYTYLAREHLDALARRFVTKKTLAYSGPVVNIAEESLDFPLVKRRLSEQQTAAVRVEIANYRHSPSAYLESLIRNPAQAVPTQSADPLLEKALSLKWHIYQFYEDTLQALVADLRIFSFSNLLASLLTFTLAYRSPTEARYPLTWFSFLIFASVLFCSSIYMDKLTFFRILFRVQMGWWYTALLMFVIAMIYRDARRTSASKSTADL